MGQAARVVYLGLGPAIVIGLVLWLLDAALLAYAVRSFRRGEIIAQLLRVGSLLFGGTSWCRLAMLKSVPGWSCRG